MKSAMPNINVNSQSKIVNRFFSIHHLPFTIHQRKLGFTLIELLVVIGVLTVLLAIVLIAINPARQFAQANDTQRRSDVNAILNAVHQYAADNKGTLPGAGEITATATVMDATNFEVTCDDIVPTYIAAMPVDPDSSVGTPGICSVYDTGSYSISVGASSRITVSTTSEVDSSTISVTR